MNLDKLFQMQFALDEHILNEHPELKEQDNLDWKVLALLVELGECANEWRGFKKWSHDQEPRITGKCSWCNGDGFIVYSYEHNDICCNCDGTGKEESESPLLEEFVDCLHFILSVGLEMNVTEFELEIIKKDSLTEQYLGLYNAASVLAISFSAAIYGQVFSAFIGLGEMLGFTWNQIEQAYLDKNAVNHGRQEGGY